MELVAKNRQLDLFIFKLRGIDLLVEMQKRDESHEFETGAVDLFAAKSVKPLPNVNLQ